MKASIALQPEVRQAIVGSPIHFKWQETQQLGAYQATVTDSNGAGVAELHVQGPEFEWTPFEPGRYRVHLAATTMDGFSVQSTEAALILVGPKFVAPTEKTKKVKILNPKTSAVTPDLNRSFKSSKFSALLGGIWMKSNEQQRLQYQVPFNSQLEVRSLHWFKDYGFEGFLRKSATRLNASKAGLNSLDLEARWHLRGLYQLDNYGSKELQLTYFAGVEVYRNPGSDSFSSSYNLFRLGVSGDYPVGTLWDMGGEFSAGVGTGGSYKYEITGRFSYYLDSKWSCGGSYRLNLFEAGSDVVTPHTLPYREGNTELATFFTYHY